MTGRTPAKDLQRITSGNLVEPFFSTDTDELVALCEKWSMLPISGRRCISRRAISRLRSGDVTHDVLAGQILTALRDSRLGIYRPGEAEVREIVRILRDETSIS